jgi:organic hydroperoxide reductase OsmC/OhrA
MAKSHQYQSHLIWTGNTGVGTKGYTQYERSFEIQMQGKQTLLGSSDPAFRGDPSRHNPEEWLLSSLSSCHMLWYLHLCSSHNITVVSYEDHAEGWMTEYENGSGRFEKVLLKPQVTILEADRQEDALLLHQEANRKCFIANSVNFEVLHEPRIYI